MLISEYHTGESAEVGVFVLFFSCDLNMPSLPGPVLGTLNVWVESECPLGLLQL